MNATTYTCKFKLPTALIFPFMKKSVLHEIKNEQMGDVLLAGVFDGHAGTAASETASSILPPLFTQALQSVSIREALERSWDITCDTYRNGCDENGECVADYDPKQGILYAETGSTDVFGKYFHLLAKHAFIPLQVTQLLFHQNATMK